MKLNLIAPSLLRPWLWFTKPLLREDLDPNPINEFARWYRLSQRLFWLEFPQALCLASTDENGLVDSRTVLLRNFDQSGFTFFTNYNSEKGKHFISSGKASMTFFWDALQRQIRIQGNVEKVTSEESDSYFRSRSRESQIAAWASMQSDTLEQRSNLDLRFKQFANQFKDIEVPRPDNWGGYRLMPQKIEFWKARPHRLHDRFQYIKDPEGTWQIRQLFP